MNENLKRCAKCEEEKSTSEFVKDAGTRDRLFRWCKSCCRDQRAKYYSSNKEAIKSRTEAKKKAEPEKWKAMYRERYRQAKAAGRVNMALHKLRNDKYIAKQGAKQKKHDAALRRRMKDPKKYEATYRDRNRTVAASLSDMYVRRQIFRKGKAGDFEVSKALLEMKREQIVIWRLARQLKGVLNKGIDDGS